MRTVDSSSHPGGCLHQAPPGPEPPLSRHPPQEQAPPPRSRHLPLSTEFLTHAAENITLPQTSFAGGNKI